MQLCTGISLGQSVSHMIAYQYQATVLVQVAYLQVKPVSRPIGTCLQFDCY